MSRKNPRLEGTVGMTEVVCPVAVVEWKWSAARWPGKIVQHLIQWRLVTLSAVVAAVAVDARATTSDDVVQFVWMAAFACTTRYIRMPF